MVRWGGYVHVHGVSVCVCVCVCLCLCVSHDCFKQEPVCLCAHIAYPSNVLLVS